MHSKTNFKTVLIFLLIAAAGLVLLGLLVSDVQLKRILFGLGAAMGMASLIQCVLYAVKPKLFKDKHRPY